MITIYHNSRCGTSRKGIEFLENLELEFEVVEYLKNIFTVDKLEEIIELLNINPLDLIRINEKLWRENFKNQSFSNAELIKIMVENPSIIQRPIVVNGKKAIIARPAELINTIL